MEAREAIVNDTVPLEIRLEAMFEPLAADLGLEIVFIELKGARGRKRLRVAADRLEGGVTVGDCARLSREISALLDVEDLIAGAFDLEVSSPGVERPLRRLAEFARFAGRDVLIHRREDDRIVELSGRLEGIDEHERVLVKVGKKTLEVALSNIEKARLTFQFGSKRKRS